MCVLCLFCRVYNNACVGHKAHHRGALLFQSSLCRCTISLLVYPGCPHVLTPHASLRSRSPICLPPDGGGPGRMRGRAVTAHSITAHCVAADEAGSSKTGASAAEQYEDAVRSGPRRWLRSR